MKCPICGAWSEVLSTRTGLRRRECANHHRFSTIEVLHTLAAKREAQRHATKVKTGVSTWQRNQRIQADPRTSNIIAAEYGLHESTIRQIKRMKES